MEARIDVSCERASDRWTCGVTVSEGSTSTRHEVIVTDADIARLAPGSAAPDDLVRRSVEFLLAREPKESILRRFELPVIGRYFPEYDRTIRQG
jgi:hypothetical protein